MRVASHFRFAPQLPPDIHRLRFRLSLRGNLLDVDLEPTQASYSLQGGSGDRRSSYEDPELLEQHLDDLARLVEVASRDGTPVWIVPFDLTAIRSEAAATRYRAFIGTLLERGLPALDLSTGFPQSLCC